MTLKELQAKTSFSQDEILALAPQLPSSLLLPFHEIPLIRWDEASGTGRIEALRRNRPDEWFYACHFLGDPVMPGCWGIDALWQCLIFFAAWRGLKGCGKPLGMENVSFFGQIRPYDGTIRCAVDVLSCETSEGETLLGGKGAVEVDGMPVYSAGQVQVGTGFWQSDGAKAPAIVRRPAPPLTQQLSYEEFRAKTGFSPAEILAVSQGALVKDCPVELGLLPSSLMLEIGEVHEIRRDPALGTGRIIASRRVDASDWFYPMNHGVKPTALSIDAVWQLMGLFLAWSGNAGTGRALGFEQVEVFDEIKPGDRELIYDVGVLKLVHAGNGDAFINADARVFADGRPILNCVNVRVGCHRGIRYSDYPIKNEMALGGKIKIFRPSA
ncbi:MAG TPA: hypothetical protein VNK24_04260 [Elusimicrobiota bacterium]|nr:hypothetical protein [Elusimicrobiota bacterium]